MAARVSRFMQHLRDLITLGGPAVCNVAVTNVCNASCDFCNYARNKNRIHHRRFIDARKFDEALKILKGRGVRYITLTGGEPLLHPDVGDIVRTTVRNGLQPSLVTNGSRLTPERIRTLVETGLHRFILSVDAPTVEAHESHRGLPGVCDRIRQANSLFRQLSVQSIASVTISRLIMDFTSLVDFLRDLGFTTVTFSYPKRTAGSSSLVYSETSRLIDFEDRELEDLLQRLADHKSLFPILNPKESLLDMVRFLRKEPQRFPCLGGYKYFFLDWDLKVWRCDTWPTPMGHVRDFAGIPLIRDGCTRCMSDCYRDSAVLLASAVAVGDAVSHLRKGRVGRAVHTLCSRNTARSLWALTREWGTLRNAAAGPR